MMPRSIEPITPGPGQESAWAYPRPPRVECCQRHVVVVFAGEVVADTTRALRVVETSRIRFETLAWLAFGGGALSLINVIAQLIGKV